MRSNSAKGALPIKIKDKKFLKDLVEEVEKNIDNQKFSVDELASNMNLSRSHLYSKVHSASGLSPKSLIRNIRLEKALVLLKEGNYNVSEISYQMGFGSPTYFNKCFHDYFGFPPGELHKIKTIQVPEGDLLDIILLKRGKRPYKYQEFLKWGLSILFILLIGAISLVALLDILPDKEKKNLPNDLSIAVLPFEDLGEEKIHEFLADGISEAILNHLGRIGGLKVISQTSVLRYKGREKDISKIVEELGVNYILEGGIQRSGNKIQISVQLSEADGQRPMWEGQYDWKYMDIIGLQSDIAREVAGRIDVNITQEEKANINHPQTESILSYEEFQKGRIYFINFLLNQDEKDYKKATGYFTRALIYDSTHAVVYAHLAEMYWIRNFRSEYYDESFMDTVRILSEKALIFNPNLAYAYNVLGQYYWETGKPVKGISCMEKAITLNRSFAGAYLHLGTYFSWMGEWEKGIPHLHTALDLDPFSVFLPVIYGRLAAAYLDICDFEKVSEYAHWSTEVAGGNNFSASYGLWLLTHSHMMEGSWEEALNYCKKLIECDSISGLRSLAEITSHHLHQYDKAIHYYEKLETIDPSHANYKQRYAYALWKNGDREKADKLMNEQIAEYERGMKLGRIGRHDPSYNLAGIYAFMGKIDRALSYLEDYHFNSGLEYYILIDPLFENLWGNKKFQKLAQDAQNKKAAIRKSNVIRSLTNAKTDNIP